MVFAAEPCLGCHEGRLSSTKSTENRPENDLRRGRPVVIRFRTGCSAGDVRLEPKSSISHRFNGRHVQAAESYTDGVSSSLRPPCSPKPPKKENPTAELSATCCNSTRPKETGSWGVRERGNWGDKEMGELGSEQDKEPNTTTSSREDKDSKRNDQRCQSPRLPSPSLPDSPSGLSRRILSFNTAPRPATPKILAATRQRARRDQVIPQAKALPDRHSTTRSGRLHDDALQTAGGRLGNQMSVKRKWLPFLTS